LLSTRPQQEPRWARQKLLLSHRHVPASSPSTGMWEVCRGCWCCLRLSLPAEPVVPPNSSLGALGGGTGASLGALGDGTGASLGISGDGTGASLGISGGMGHPWVSQEMGQGHPRASLVGRVILGCLRRWDRGVLARLRSSGCSLDFPVSSFLISLSPREKSPKDQLFSFLFLFSLRHSLLPKEGCEDSHLCQRWWDGAVPKRSTQASTKCLGKK